MAIIHGTTSRLDALAPLPAAQSPALRVARMATLAALGTGLAAVIGHISDCLGEELVLISGDADSSLLSIARGSQSGDRLLFRSSGR
jgi:hypothetical protein